jgi:hypothetical protein
MIALSSGHQMWSVYIVIGQAIVLCLVSKLLFLPMVMSQLFFVPETILTQKHKYSVSFSLAKRLRFQNISQKEKRRFL